MTAFSRYIGIDYSGAESPESSLKGLRVYSATTDQPATEVPPPPSPRKYWTRKGLAHWLADTLCEDTPTLVGIDHGFSFPLRYFEKHGLPPDWEHFLDDFQRHWPTDGEHTYVDFIRDGNVGNGAAREGNRRWRRLTEERARAAKSVFHFDVQGSVAKSTHSGLPWLLFLRRQLGDRVHFWPFDGWTIETGKSTILEVYPSLWRHAFPTHGRTGDQHDAYVVAMSLREADCSGQLPKLLTPDLPPHEEAVARIEGWILGVATGNEAHAGRPATQEARSLQKEGKMTALTERYVDAVNYARIAHAAQTRKGSGIPYIYHLLAVSSMVLEYGGNEDQAIAGLLHDVLEDCGRDHIHTLRAQFGDAVARIVLACTDGNAEEKASHTDSEAKRADWRRRKMRYLAKLETEPEDALLVSACDKLHNARAILSDLENPEVAMKVFDRFTGGLEGTLQYHHSLVEIFGRRHAPPARELAAVVERMYSGSVGSWPSPPRREGLK